MSYKISNSRLDLYRTCARKYEIQYVEGYEPDKTFGALHFGSAIDKALNHLLVSKKNKILLPDGVFLLEAQSIFKEEMNKYTGQNELVYFKNELPPNFDLGNASSEDAQIAAFRNLLEVGGKMIDTYATEILPRLDEIIDVQIEKKIVNADGDTFTMIIDFIARIGDKIILFDNKTTSDLKKQYTEKSTHNSQQLNLYFEQLSDICTHIGYIPMSKKLLKGEVEYAIIVTRPNPEVRDRAYEELETTLDKIKANEFPKNPKSCWLYGKICPFYGACQKNNYKGLIKKDRT